MNAGWLVEPVIWGTCAIAAFGCLYHLAAAAVVQRFGEMQEHDGGMVPGVTIVKPLARLTCSLYDDLVSFCDQDYRGPLQIVFGVRGSVDGVTEVVRRLISERPKGDLELVVHASGHARNPKIANLMGLEPHIRYPVVIIADDDIRVGRDYVRQIVTTMNERGAGAVTCLYRGASGGSVWARLSSMGIDYHFLPNVLIGLKLGLARPCFGSTIALRRETLAAIGGFQAFGDCIADDYAIGAAVRTAGMTVTIPPLVVAHSCCEQTLGELLSHELRWGRTVRAVNPGGYAGLFVTHPLPFAILGAALTGFGAVGVAAIAAAIASRLILQWQVDRALKVPPNRWWLMPVRDLLAFGVYLVSFFVNVVRWDERRYRVASDGTLTAMGEPKA